MRSLWIALAPLISVAHAQNAAPPPPPIQQALGQQLMEAINSEVQLRAQLLTAQERIKELETELDALKKAGGDKK